MLFQINKSPSITAVWEGRDHLLSATSSALDTIPRCVDTLAFMKPDACEPQKSQQDASGCPDTQDTSLSPLEAPSTRSSLSSQVLRSLP